MGVVAVSGGSLPGGAADSGQGGALESLECHATCLKSAQAVTRNTTLGVCVCEQQAFIPYSSGPRWTQAL